MSHSLLYIIWFRFLIRYRRNALGPLWLLVGPALFIGLLGFLFSRVGSVDPAVFIPHLTIGLITWTLIQGFVIQSTTIFQRMKPQIMQTGMNLSDVILMDMGTTVIQFLHQAILIIIVLIYYQVSFSFYSLVSLLGLMLILINGYWLAQFIGVLGARYRDLSEMATAIMRIAFLATPIIWMPSGGGRGGILGAFLTFNPFYHFLEIVRAPLLNNAVDPISWVVVMGITLFGSALGFIWQKRFHKLVPLWI